jgi:hypothetical protein
MVRYHTDATVDDRCDAPHVQKKCPLPRSCSLSVWREGRSAAEFRVKFGGGKSSSAPANEWLIQSHPLPRRPRLASGIDGPTPFLSFGSGRHCTPEASAFARTCWFTPAIFGCVQTSCSLGPSSRCSSTAAFGTRARSTEWSPRATSSIGDRSLRRMPGATSL